MKNVNIYLNNEKLSVVKNSTVLQACAKGGIEIPRFCYHEKLSIAGNCRMCLVEVKNSPKPVASCAMPVLENMAIYTNTTLVRKAREGVIEFLLANHPLDCPICDQGGECDLQDQSMIFGGDRGRYYEYKRAVENKNCGILIKTLMTRCIHCTRCVRFLEEIAGVGNLGMLGRGAKSEIGTYVDSILLSEISGNIIDLCPVGALTSKPYAYKARSWELRRVETICILDSYGSNICVDLRGNDILRVLPKYNHNINEEWISDRTRFSYDSFKFQRLMSIQEFSNSFSRKNLSWNFFLNDFKKTLAISTNLHLIVGNFVDLETLYTAKLFLNQLGYSSPKSKENLNSIDFRYNYLGDNSEKIKNNSIICLIGTNLRQELPLLNLKIRNNFLNKNLEIFTLGNTTDLTYNQQHLGLSYSFLNALIQGNHFYCLKFSKAEQINIFLGSSVIERQDFQEIFNLLKAFKLKYKNVNIKLLHKSISNVGSYELGCTSGVNDFSDYSTNIASYRKNIYYLLGLSDLTLNSKDTLKVYYQGTHGESLKFKPNLMLPITHFIETSSSYLTYQGYYQKTKFVQKPPHFARDGWKVLKVLSLSFNSTSLPFVSLRELRKRIAKYTSLNIMKSKILEVKFFGWKNWFKFSKKNFIITINDFYVRDNLTKNSLILVKNKKITESYLKTNFIKV